jgi:hypothetical protein
MMRESSQTVLDLLGLKSSEPVSIGPNDRVSTATTDAYAPDIDDLSRLYDLVRARRVSTILEFGCGHSTLVLVSAIEANRLEFGDSPEFAKLRRNNPFELHTVDASTKWLEAIRARIPQRVIERAHLHHSPCRIGAFNNRICHYYNAIPNVCPDLIYLDGPFQHDVEGEIDGLHFRHHDRTVLAGDLLRIEWLLLPGCMILVDGRTNNARFLKSNFQRDWRYERAADVHMFELVEPPLGRLNELQLKFCLGR